MKLKEERIGGETVYKGKILDLEVDEVICPNGHHSKREVIRHCRASAILVKVGDKFLLEEQYRYPYNEVILEIPAGKCDPGEDPLDCAARELEEETGLIAKKLTHLGDMYPSPAYTDEIISIYWTEEVEPGQRHLDYNEAINLKHFTFEEIRKLIGEGRIKDAKTLAAFTHYLLQNPIE